jgi:hypothetical protein
MIKRQSACNRLITTVMHGASARMWTWTVRFPLFVFEKDDHSMFLIERPDRLLYHLESPLRRPIYRKEVTPT